MEKLEGNVKRIVFRNPETGFAVVKLESGREEQTAVGNIAFLNEGEYVVLLGRWRKNPVYGEEFLVEAVERVLQQSERGIERFLAAVIKGLGPVLARRIVEKFGERTVEILDREPRRLEEVEGIGAQKRQQIEAQWRKHREENELLLFLQSLGISLNLSYKLIRKYGFQIKDIIRTNPYRLVFEVKGIGFKTADSIARRVGFDLESPERAKAAVIFVLENAANFGDTYITERELAAKLRELEVNPEVGREVLHELVDKGFVVWEGEKVGLRYFYDCEKEIARRLRQMVLMEELFPAPDLTSQLRQVESHLGIELDSDQLEAIRRALSSRFLIISGGPGTGKTTIVRFIVELYRRAGYRVKLASPTGRAAKRLSEATGYPASTVHRLLEFNPVTGKFERNETNQLAVDLLVVDEASMLDVPLFMHLLRALPFSAHLILVGDKDQLPSVGPGNILHDILSNPLFPRVFLRRIYRQSEGSLIVLNAHRINRGQMPILKPGNQEFDFIQVKGEHQAFEEIMKLAVEILPARFNLPPLNTAIQVISPMYRGEVGVDNLNRQLQLRLNPYGKEVKIGQRSYRIGDKVMQTSNNYFKEVFNGEVGRIVDYDEASETFMIDFDGRVIDYSREEMDDVVLAYAISVHKAQGSEYEAIIFPVVTQHWIMLQRNLVYTALTRARRTAYFVGNLLALKRAIANNRPLRRKTWLGDLLKES